VASIGFPNEELRTLGNAENLREFFSQGIIIHRDHIRENMHLIEENEFSQGRHND